MKGTSNRIGYLLTHIAIIIICIGGLADGNLPLKIKTMTGDMKVETRDITVSKIPAESRLPDNNPSFRANVSIPEGAKINYAFINIGGGFLLQPLPFAIEVKDFRIEHYQNGQPKSFESDLVIHDPETRESIEHTIAVNHPLIYKGYTIYQASFADGGTRLHFQMHSFHDHGFATADLTGTVSNHSELNTPDGAVRIEFDDFRKFNIFPASENENNRKFTDYGPSFTYKIRQRDGTAREYINYMYPVPMEEKLFFLSGVRSEINDEFRYLYIPVDADNSPDLFFRFQTYLYDDSIRRI
jgi:cytochrome c biogenesis protein